MSSAIYFSLDQSKILSSGNGLKWRSSNSALFTENEKQRKYRREPILCSQGSDEGIGSDPKTPSNVSTLLSRTSSLTPAVKFWDYENIPR